MVNHGIPSENCRTCIKRKIKCDLRRPACGQCNKGARQCGGYRNRTDVMFRHETQKVIVKEIKKSITRRTVSSLRTGSSRTSNRTAKAEPQTTGWAPAELRLSPVPRTHLESDTVDFFTNNFVSTDINDIRTNLFWLPIDLSEILRSDAARLSLQCAGCVALARLQGSAALHRHAQHQYGQALALLRNVWQESRLVKADCVLVAVMVLAFYEAMAGNGSASREGWQTHLQGLGALFEHRGKDAMNSAFGIRMFMQSRSQVMLGSLQQKVPVPEPFASRWRKAIPQKAIPRYLRPADDMAPLLVRLAKLQAKVIREPPDRTLQTAWDLARLNEELGCWATTLGPDWSFSSRFIPGIDIPWWEQRQDIYSNHWMAHFWNLYREARITIHDLIHIAVSCVEPDTISNEHCLYAALSIDVQEMVVEICASVPAAYRPSTTTGSQATDAALPIGIVYFLLYPLFVVGNMESASVDLTSWVIRCLKRMEEVTGIEQARKMAMFLKLRHYGPRIAACGLPRRPV